MIQSILMMGGLGVVIGTALVIASRAFYVYENPKVTAINDILPGANCGGCGYPGCMANAEAIVESKADVNSCVAAGDEVALAIAEVMGVSVSDKEPEFAAPGCFYPKNKVDINYIYSGIMDCRAASMLMGGMKTCQVGCLGLGTCVTACKFGALQMGNDGLPRVDQEKCTGCGACERICPKNIIRLTSVTRRIIREYTLAECITPCQRVCPSGIDIKEYIRLIKEENFHGSIQVIKERMPFPTVISRICPAFCEFNCRRLLQDEAVAINKLKRFVTDYEMNRNERSQPYTAPKTNKQIAVIGGGVEGLAAAYFSARLGHEPTVFEATDELGGILRKAISKERLSMDILEWDIQGIIELGVIIKKNTVAGRNFTIPELLGKGYEAIFIATGGWDSRLARQDLDLPANIFPDTYLLIDLLRERSSKALNLTFGSKAIIVEGGLASMYAISRLKENGIEDILILSRNPSPPDKKEKNLSGVSFVYRVGITRLMGENDNLTGVEYTNLDTREITKVDAQILFIGAGRFPELVFVPMKSETILDKEQISESSEDAIIETPLYWEGVEIPKKAEQIQDCGIFSEKEPISEYASAVAAINGGRRAASAIHHLIYGLDFQASFNMIVENSIIQDITSLNNVSFSFREVTGSVCSESDFKEKFSTGFSTKEAKNEADRCLQCGLLCYEKDKN